jgi:hypothetical protein
LIKTCSLLLSCSILLSALIAASAINAYGQPCQPSIVDIFNSYPQSANPNEKIEITTTITVSCMLPGYQLRVDIMPTGYTRILSMAAGPVAVNSVTSPETNGPWSLDVVTSLIDYPYGRILSIKRDQITIQIGPAETSVTQSVSTIRYSSTITATWTSTTTVHALTRTRTETRTVSVLLLQQDQTYAPVAIVFGAAFAIAAWMLLRARRGGR